MRAVERHDAHLFAAFDAVQHLLLDVERQDDVLGALDEYGGHIMPRGAGTGHGANVAWVGQQAFVQLTLLGFRQIVVEDVRVGWGDETVLVEPACMSIVCFF